MPRPDVLTAVKKLKPVVENASPEQHGKVIQYDSNTDSFMYGDAVDTSLTARVASTEGELGISEADKQKAVTAWPDDTENFYWNYIWGGYDFTPLEDILATGWEFKPWDSGYRYQLSVWEMQSQKQIIFEAVAAPNGKQVHAFTLNTPVTLKANVQYVIAIRPEENSSRDFFATKTKPTAHPKISLGIGRMDPNGTRDGFPSGPSQTGKWYGYMHLVFGQQSLKSKVAEIEGKLPLNKALLDKLTQSGTEASFDLSALALRSEVPAPTDTTAIESRLADLEDLNIGQSEIQELKSIMTAAGGETSIATPAGYSKDKDLLHVYENGILIEEDLDYTINADSLAVTLLAPAEANDSYRLHAIKRVFTDTGLMGDAVKIQGKDVPVPTVDATILSYDSATDSYEWMTPVLTDTSTLMPKVVQGTEGTNILIQPMTGYNVPAPYKLDASRFATDAWKLFDNNPSTYWSPSSGSGYVTLDVGTSKQIVKYAITGWNGDTGFSPGSWTVQGSNDNATWTTIDTRSNQTFASNERRIFTLSSAANYRYYKIDISQATNPNYSIYMMELEYMDGPLPVGNKIPYLKADGTLVPTIHNYAELDTMASDIDSLKASSGNATKIQSKSVTAPVAADDKKVLQYDNASGSFKYTALPTPTDTSGLDTRLTAAEGSIADLDTRVDALEAAPAGGGTVDDTRVVTLEEAMGIAMYEVKENAETDPSSVQWEGDWIRSTIAPYEGSYVLTNRDITDNETSYMRGRFIFGAGAKVSFMYKTDTETNYDNFRFSIDNTEMLWISGANDWTLFEADVPEGEHVLYWEYDKDSSSSSGTDSIYIDNIVLTNVKNAYLPDVIAANKEDIAMLKEALKIDMKAPLISNEPSFVNFSSSSQTRNVGYRFNATETVNLTAFRIGPQPGLESPNTPMTIHVNVYKLDGTPMLPSDYVFVTDPDDSIFEERTLDSPFALPAGDYYVTFWAETMAGNSVMMKYWISDGVLTDDSLPVTITYPVSGSSPTDLYETTQPVSVNMVFELTPVVDKVSKIDELDSRVATLESAPSGSGVDTFLELTDTPDVFSAGKFVAVKADGSALEFVDAPVTDTSALETRMTTAEGGITDLDSRVDALEAAPAGGGTGVDTFLELTDTPDAYAAGKIVAVKADGTGLEFTDAPAADTQNAITIQSKSVPVPAAADDEKALVYDNDTSSFKYVALPASTDTSALMPKVVQGTDSTLIPAMTANNAPSPYVASADTESSTNLAYQAFDASNSTEWVNSGPSGWLQINLGSAKSINRYDLTGSATVANSPKSWTLQGSNDATSWTTLDTQTNAAAWTAGEKRTYTITATTGFRYYRLTVASNQGGTATAVTALQLMLIATPIANKIAYIDGTGVAQVSTYDYSTLALIGDSTKLHGKPVPAPAATDDEKALVYDNDSNSFRYTSLQGPEAPLQNGSIAYAYNADGKVETETVTGDVTRTTTYTYFPTGDTFAGKVKTETITQPGKTTTKTYTYDATSLKLTSISVTTTTA